MKRAEYLGDSDVRAFVVWLEPRFGPGGFHHSWVSRKPKESWSCTSLFDAYRQYHWNGRGFEQDSRYLDAIAMRLRRAFREGDRPEQERAADAMLSWGGVRNIGRPALSDFHDRLGASVDALRPEDADTDRLSAVPMNSGFTKVYHLLLPGLPMYDTRVAAALGYLTRRFLEDRGQVSVPVSLMWACGPARRRRDGTAPLRDPSDGPFAFPRLRSGVVHARSNVMAAWLMGELAQFECFAELAEDVRIRAVESALFMVGYDLTPPVSRLAL